MSTDSNDDFKNLTLISQVIKAKQKLNKEKEQNDTESLNTMDYYKDDSSNKNSLIDESKTNNKLLFDSNKKEEINKTSDNIKNKKDFSLKKNNNENINKIESKNNDIKNRKYSTKNKKPQNIQEGLNEVLIYVLDAIVI